MIFDLLIWAIVDAQEYPQNRSLTKTEFLWILCLCGPFIASAQRFFLLLRGRTKFRRGSDPLLVALCLWLMLPTSVFSSEENLWLAYPGTLFWVVGIGASLLFELSKSSEKPRKGKINGSR